MIRTLMSPGVELKETDKSQYTSDIGSVPRALVMGYASKGPIQSTTDITSMADFRTIYGTPTNEVERYFYNAAEQLIGAGATVVAAKIPYQDDDKYFGVKYSIGSEVTSTKDIDDLDAMAYLESLVISNEPEITATVSANIGTVTSEDPESALTLLKATDSTISGVIPVSSSEAWEISYDTNRELEEGTRSGLSSSFVIVDKSRGVYKAFTGNGSNVDCLGILPVVTTAANAMAIADQISGVRMNTTDLSGTNLQNINLFESLDNIDYISSVTSSEMELDNSEISDYWSIGPKTVENANTLNSISKIAAQFFPAVTYSSAVKNYDDISAPPFDRNYFSYVGVVVFKIGVERGSGALVAEPIEAFAGSLLRDAKDLRTNASAFIEDIINNTSNYISIYVADDVADNNNGLLKKDSLLYASPSNGLILGIPPKTISKKKIKYSELTKYIDKIFKAQSNILATTLDVVVDAGLSTIGECVNGNTDGVEVKKLYILKQIGNDKNKGPWHGWRAIVNKMKQFCESTRKDCVFVADSPRFLSLKNNKKIVSNYSMDTSVADNILPKIKLISGINSSYGFGYVPWFKIGDASDGTSFWCPPSIFGASKYIYVRTRWNTWYAPAGLNYGVISVDDTSFEPDLNARNVIYSNSWNYALTDIQNGATTLEGQKTFQSYQSALDRINVRSLLLDLERRTFKIARNYIYEPNTADTRQQFIDNVTPIFNSTQAQGGCYAYKIVADESINTSQTIDQGEFHIRIGIQPTKLIEFILCEFVVSRTGSNWAELVME